MNDCSIITFNLIRRDTRHHILRLFLFVPAFSIVLSPYVPAQTKEEYSTITAVEKMPVFNNNSSFDFLIWVYQNLKYPESAIKDSISGQVFAKFKIDSSGMVSDIEIVRSVRCDLDSEVRRVILLSPKWTPGQQNGRNIGIYYTLPIEFDIKDRLFLKKIKEFSKRSKKNK